MSTWNSIKANTFNLRTVWIKYKLWFFIEWNLTLVFLPHQCNSSQPEEIQLQGDILAFHRCQYSPEEVCSLIFLMRSINVSKKSHKTRAGNLNIGHLWEGFKYYSEFFLGTPKKPYIWSQFASCNIKQWLIKITFLIVNIKIKNYSTDRPGNRYCEHLSLDAKRDHTWGRPQPLRPGW